MDNRSDGVSGLTFPGLFGLAWQIHADRYGTTRAQVSSVVRKNKANGLLNPLAQMGMELTDDQIIQSPLICDPLRLFDCCPTSDGAAAVLLIAEDRLQDVVGDAIRIVAAVQTRGSARIAGHRSLHLRCNRQRGGLLSTGRNSGFRRRLRRVTRLLSIAEIIDTEDLGIIPRGRAAGTLRRDERG